MPAPPPYRSAPSGYSRPPSSGRPGRAETRDSSGRVAGILLFGLAALTLVEHFLIARWIHLETSATQSYTTAGLATLLGLALFQGSEGSRKAALWLTGLGIVALLAVIPIGFLTAPEAGISIAVVAGGGLLAAVALVGLLTGDASPARVTLCAIAFVVGSVGSVAIEMWLVKRVERELRALLTEWSTPEREIHDELAGLDLKLPEGWVLLKPGNPMVPGDGVRGAFGETSLGAVAAVILEAEGQGYMSSDHYLDGWLAARKDKLERLTQKTRQDVRIGPADGRKMTFTWVYHGRGMEGFATAWKDGHRYFCFSGWTTSSLAPSATGRFAALEKSLAFSAPVDTFLQELSPRVTAACALLSTEAVPVMVRSLPRDATPETYCRRGLEWALRGQGQLPPGESADFRAITQKLYGTMRDQDRARLGRYMERLRFGLSTDSAEDHEMIGLLSVAVRKLSVDDQTRLRGLPKLAIEVGRLL